MSSGCARTPTRSAPLFRDLLINVTSFFRDAEAFEVLEAGPSSRGCSRARARTTRSASGCPGCATGEEVYSIAILVREHMDDSCRARRRSSSSPPTSTRRRSGVARAAPLPGAAAGRRLAASGSSASSPPTAAAIVLAKEVRELCIFSPHSVIRDPPFSRIDLVSCRNLLIYLDAELQDQVIPIFHYALRPGGFLFLGTAENVTQPRRPVRAARQEAPDLSQAAITSRAADHLPSLLPRASLRSAATPRPARDHRRLTALNLRRAVEAHVLERFAPPHVVVNREGDVVHYSGAHRQISRGGARRAEPPAAGAGPQGAAARPAHGAARGDRDARRRVIRERVAVEVDDHVQQFDADDRAAGRRRLERAAVRRQLQRSRPAAERRRGGPHRQRRRKADVAADELERELRETRERLQS